MGPAGMFCANILPGRKKEDRVQNRIFRNNRQATEYDHPKGLLYKLKSFAGI